jgi:hypothetical protein
MYLRKLWARIRDPALELKSGRPLVVKTRVDLRIEILHKCCSKGKTKKDKLLGLSPRTSYTDRATAACRRN